MRTMPALIALALIVASCGVDSAPVEVPPPGCLDIEAETTLTSSPSSCRVDWYDFYDTWGTHVYEVDDHGRAWVGPVRSLPRPGYRVPTYGVTIVRQGRCVFLACGPIKFGDPN